MIQSIKIEKLYYIYSYEIDFTKAPNVLILTGPNGFGKTTILQIINHLCSLKLWYFYMLPFSRIEVCFDEWHRILINKPTMDGRGYGDVTFEFYMLSASPRESLVIDAVAVRHFLSRSIPAIRQFDVSRLDEYLENTRDEEVVAFVEEKVLLMPEFLQNQNCVMIEEQRLVAKKTQSNTSEYSKTVEDIQKRISSFYSEAQKAYNVASLKIDGTFVKRLSDIKPTNKVKHIKKEQIYRDVIQKIEKYKKYDLVSELEVVSNLGVHYNEVLKLYLTDLDKKLSSIEPYYEKLSTFDKMVSGKHLSYKRLLFKDDKMQVVGLDGHEIPIRKLSSGEQNLLVLCHNLVFGLDNKNILLIDEPENSLHMAWLQEMLEDYIRIAKTTQCQIIIATHSPAFIHGHWDLTYDLCENGSVQESESDS